jgi:hypothetical protein
VMSFRIAQAGADLLFLPMCNYQECLISLLT